MNEPAGPEVRVSGEIEMRMLLFWPSRRFEILANFREYQPRPKNILCMTAAGLGDMIMDAPAIHALKQKFPDAELTVLAHYSRGTNEICQLMTSVDETIDLGLRSYRWPDVIRFMFSGFWKLLFKLRKRKFDLAVVFYPNPVRRLLLALLGAKRWVYTNRVSDYPGRQNLRLLHLLGAEETDDDDIFQIPEPDIAEQILPGHLRRPLICIHPFCGMTWRRWNKFGTLTEMLSRIPGRVIIVGKKKNYLPAGPGYKLVNMLSLAELFWVIRQCDVLVTADSGPMHMGFAVGTPTVALFGPVKPDLRVPRNERYKHKILYKPSCESEKTLKTTQRKELDNTNMQQIHIDEVYAAVRQLLATRDDEGSQKTELVVIGSELDYADNRAFQSLEKPLYAVH